MTSELAQAWRRTWRLAWPLAFVQLNTNLTGLIDTAIAGRAGELSLAATGLGSAVYMTASVAGMGCGFGSEPLIAQAMGAGRTSAVRHHVWQGIWLALGVSLPLGLVGLAAAWALPFLGLEAPLAGQARLFLYGRLPSVVPFCLLFVLRAYLQAAQRTRPIVTSALILNGINALLDWAFLWGIPQMGVPAWGVFGLGLASSLAGTVQTGMLAWAALAADPKLGRPVPPHGPSLRRLVGLGAPAGMQTLAEVGIFAGVSVVMGGLGSTAMAAHQSALMLVSCAFATCLGVGAAASAQVGLAIGRGDMRDARLAGVCALLMGIAIMTISTVCMWTLPAPLLRLFTQDAAVLRAATGLLWVAGFFQIADGIQAVMAGALRGAGETAFAFWANIAAHWCIGAPVAWGLALGLEWGPPGLWWGLTASLTVVSILLTRRFWRVVRAPVSVPLLRHLDADGMSS